MTSEKLIYPGLNCIVNGSEIFIKKRPLLHIVSWPLAQISTRKNKNKIIAAVSIVSKNESKDNLVKGDMIRLEIINGFSNNHDSHSVVDHTSFT
jgi:hypothetical protein